MIKNKNARKSLLLSPLELDNALCFLTKLSQKASFPKEYAALQNHKKVSNSSPLITLSPFLDSKGCIRVGGRLRKSFLSYNEKHPFVISKYIHFSKLLMQQAHLKSLHGGQ